MISPPTTSAEQAPARFDPPDTHFVNAVRLTLRHWLSVAAIAGLVLPGTPWLWKRIERFDMSSDYRVPFALSKDYWLYQRQLERIPKDRPVLIGDSVVWGEYVRADGTLSHFLSEQLAQPGQVVNAGVNGLFPLALEGLVRYYAGPLRHRQIILHCNLLWLSSPKADLHTAKEERFNHADLVPQLVSHIPCYRAGLNHRLAVVLEREFPFAQWANHLQIAYFGQKNVLSWTLEEEDGNPPRFPNAFKNPFSQITLAVPGEPAIDPERGPASPRHKPWSNTGQGSTRFEWVELERSLQWAAFQRLVPLLKSRGNDVLVVLGPFNEHIMSAENRAVFRRLRDGVADWCERSQVACVVPECLPSALYADASHPLTQGYELLAKTLYRNPAFQQWLNPRRTAEHASVSRSGQPEPVPTQPRLLP